MDDWRRAVPPGEWPAVLLLAAVFVFVYAAVCFGPASRPPPLPGNLPSTATPPAP